MERAILHIDCNKFYASVECLHRPEIRDKPVAVGGSAEERRGIILTKMRSPQNTALQQANRCGRQGGNALISS